MPHYRIRYIAYNVYIDIREAKAVTDGYFSRK